jgi:hypothetical protein
MAWLLDTRGIYKARWSYGSGNYPSTKERVCSYREHIRKVGNFMEKIFTGNGIEIVMREGEFYLIYDAGEICDRMEEIKITEDEVELAKKSSMDAYNIIIKYQNEMMFGKDKDK